MIRGIKVLKWKHQIFFKRIRLPSANGTFVYRSKPFLTIKLAQFYCFRMAELCFSICPFQNY